MKIKKLSCLLLVSILSISCSNPMAGIVDLAITQLETYTLENAVQNINVLSAYYEILTKDHVDSYIKLEMDFRAGERYVEMDTNGETKAIMENGDEYYMYEEVSDSNFETSTITKEQFESDFNGVSMKIIFNNTINDISEVLETLKDKSNSEIEEYYTHYYLEVPDGLDYTNSVHMEFVSKDNGFDFKTTFNFKTDSQDVEFVEQTVLNEFGLPIYIYYYDNMDELTKTESTTYNKTITKFQIEE